MVKKTATQAIRDGKTVLAQVLRMADPRPSPTSPTAEKILYAVRFANAMADALVKDLTGRMPGVTASAQRNAGSVRGPKQLDVNFSTQTSGLLLGISLKSVHIRETTGAKRYTHNFKRNEEELRIEASGYHKRQPYAVMAGILFLPFDACEDGKKNNPSSFGSWVRHLRPYAGRVEPQDDVDRFERIFIGLYELDGSDLRFFDVTTAPPKNGRPNARGASSATLEYEQMLNVLYHDYLRRNAADFVWADGTEDPIDIRDSDEQP